MSSSTDTPLYTNPGKTIKENIDRLLKAKSDIRKSIEKKGVV